jgi:O-antigen/teichoic acid export membrane protein
LKKSVKELEHEIDKTPVSADDAKTNRVYAAQQHGAESSSSSSAPVARRFSMHVAWTFATRVLMTINSVGAGVIVARWLGAEGLGALAVINVAVATIVQLASVGLPSANTYFIAQDERRYYAPAAMNSLLFALVGGCVLAIGLMLLAMKQPVLFGYISPKLIGIAAVSIPFQLLTLLGLNIFLAVGRIDRFNQLDVAGQSFVLINAVLALLLLGAGLWTLVSLNTAATILVSLLIVWLIGRHIAGREERTAWRFDFRLLRRMMKYGIKFHVATLAGLLIFRADLLVVNHFRGAAEAGVYSVASQVAMMLMVLPGVIATLLFPRVTAEQETRAHLTCRVTRHTTFVMLLICLLSVPASFLLPLLYGAAFKDVTVQLLILLPGVFLIGIESVLVQYFNAEGLPPAIPLFWAATLLINIALTFVLAPSYGARGAALASTLSYTIIFALVALYFRARAGRSLVEALLPGRAELRELLLMLGRGRPSVSAGQAR